MFLALKVRNFSSRRIKKMECFNLKEYTGSNKSITGKKFVKLTLSVSSLCVFSHMYCSRDINITSYRMTSTRERGNVFTTWNRNILIRSFFYITGREGCQRRSWSNGTTRTYFPLKIRFVG